MKRIATDLENYLKKPYTRMVIPDEESGWYTAKILEFPGCISQGKTVQEAYEQLEDAAISWIQAALDAGQDIPQPLLLFGYGGKIALRLPKSLHKQAAIAAERDGASLNQFIATAVAEKVGAIKLYHHIIEQLDKRIYVTHINATFICVPGTSGMSIIGTGKVASNAQQYLDMRPVEVN